MAIISLEKQKKGERFNLYLDGEFYSGIEPDAIVKYGIKDGVEMSKEKIEEILLESESFYAFNKALKYLSKSMKTEGEILNYLTQKGFKKNYVLLALEKLKEYKYLDDRIYVKNYIDFYKNKYGKNKIKQNLLNKKIDEEILNEFLNYEEEENLDYIVTLIQKQSKSQEMDLKLKQKITRNLYSKGYDFDIIKKAFKKVVENEGWD